jgi:hypothetical protein
VVGDCDDLDFFSRVAIDNVEGEIHENEAPSPVTSLGVTLGCFLYSKERMLHGANELSGSAMASFEVPIGRT